MRDTSYQHRNFGSGNGSLEFNPPDNSYITGLHKNITVVSVILVKFVIIQKE